MMMIMMMTIDDDYDDDDDYDEDDDYDGDDYDEAYIQCHF